MSLSLDKKPSLNIAIYTLDFQWAGGIDLLHGLVKGLLTQEKRRCSVFILVHDPSVPAIKSIYRKLTDVARTAVELSRNPSAIKSISPFKKDSQVNNDDYQQINNIKEIFSKEDVEIIYYNDYGYEGKLNALQSIKADVVLPVLLNGFPPSCPVPWVGYLFDFVYKYYTHLYTKEFCLRTDINYATTLLNAKSVIVNSKATHDDLNKFIPYAKSEIYNLPFAPYTNESIYNAAVAESDILEKYKIVHPYFVISNQFWLHKSHETAFEALRILRNEQGNHIEIVCTGRMTDLSGTDERKKQLLQHVENLGLTNAIHFLGHIPKTDQLALMLRSVAVLQPTLFEGGPGGGAVYMAVANGVPAIISDIEVNKEIQNESLVTFFKASDANDLAIKMGEALTVQREIVMYEILRLNNKERLTQLGDTLINCIDFTMQSYSKN
jgi:glycosyltransferase involved in cell wall biosynthesis